MVLIAKLENSQPKPFLVLQPNLAYGHVQWAHKKLNKLSTFKNQEIIFIILPEKNLSILTKLRVFSQLHKDMLMYALLLDMVSTTGEGDGNPLQCSCLENPVDRGAWWAAVYGAAQSRTRLKRLSSSSSSYNYHSDPHPTCFKH